MKNNKISKLFVQLFLILLCATNLYAEDWRFIGDIEGIPKRFEQLQKEGRITPNANQSWDLAEGQSLVFEGDLWKRGPYGIRTVKWVQDLLARYNKDGSNPRVVLALGNHDLNTISLIQWLPNMELGQHSAFNDWLKEKKLPNTLVSRIDYWAEWNGINDKINWFWVEKVSEKLKVDPTDKDFAEKFFPQNKPNLELLDKVIAKDNIYNEFYNFVKPGGPVWDLYRKGNVINTWTDKSGSKFLAWHSGSLSQANFGVVPGSSYNYFDYERLNSLPLAEAKKEASISLTNWSKAYNSYVNSELDDIEKHWYTLKGKDGKTQIQNSPSTKKIANNIYNNRMGPLADAGWDPITKKLNFEANSLVYPDPRFFKDNSIPGLPEQKIVDILGLADVDFGVSGHQPVGDGMIHRTAIPKNGDVVQLLLTDTSFSPTEQEDHVSVKDGKLHFEAKTREGFNLVIERPSNHELGRWQEEVKKFNLLTDIEKSQLPEVEIKRLKDLAHKLSAYNKLGMIANGWLITGFEGKLNPTTGKMEQDLDRFVLFQKTGYKIEYKTVDVWGLEGVKLEPAVADLRQMALNASEAKVDELKAHNKQVLKIQDLLRLTKNKNLMITSGPALNSMQKALKNADAEKMLESHLKEFEKWLLSIPATDEWVFMGGGTHGFEEERNKVVAKVNLERIQSGKKPFEIVGLATGITGGSELDPNVKKYFNLKAFYWDDYQKEMLNILDSKSNRPKSIVFDFAGGGGIVTQQLKETAEFIAKGNDAKIHLIPGLSPFTTSEIPSADDLKKMAATDAFIHSNLGKTLIDKNTATVINDGQYQSHFGDKGNYSYKLTPLIKQEGKLKIGILTGTFDPPHIGHKQLAQEMKKRFGLDAVYFIATDIDDYKPNKQSLENRKKLLKFLLEDDPSLKLLPQKLEKKVKGLDLNGTYRVLKENLPDQELYGIAGEDTFDWYQKIPAEKRVKGINMLISRREGYESIKIPASIDGYPVTVVNLASDISSTKIRESLAKGIIPKEVTPKMGEFILANQLYKVNPNQNSPVPNSNRFGRLLRGRFAEDFKTMSDDPSRKIIFFMDEKRLIETGNMDEDKLLPSLGYTDDYAAELKKNGFKFKLLGFNAEENQVLPATWDNMVKMIESIYPKEVADKIKAVLPQLKTTKFSDIEKLYNKSFSQIYSEGKNAADYITSEKLVSLKDPTLWDVRAFLYNELRLSDLYSGDGYTYLPDGRKGLPEYIGINKDLSKLKGTQLTDINVSPLAGTEVKTIEKLPAKRPTPMECSNAYSLIK